MDKQNATETSSGDFHTGESDDNKDPPLKLPELKDECIDFAVSTVTLYPSSRIDHSKYFHMNQTLKH